MKRQTRRTHRFGWMRLLLVLWLGGASPGTACGPDFPNWLLTDSEAVLRKPEADFGQQIEWMRLVTTTNVARLADDPVQDTVAMDLADLRRALRDKGTPDATIDTIVARYQVERMKAHPQLRTGADSGSNSPSPARLEPPRVPPGLPREFEAYFRGAVAWHQTNVVAARREWLRLLENPPGERRYKSTWAAFMLGKSWETNSATEAVRWYRRVRELASSGFVDSLGLSVESLGWEARLQWQKKDWVASIELYLEQAAAGDPTAENSLRQVARDALRGGRAALTPLARNLRCRRLITAFVISGGFREPEIDVDGEVREAALLLWSKASGSWSKLPAPNTAWHRMREPARIWLEAVESARAQDVESAEQLALAAYQVGEMDLARRWLNLARKTPAANWLRAKLCLRDGKLTEGLTLLTNVERSASGPAPGLTNAVGGEMLGNLQVRTGEYIEHVHASPAEAVRAEMAVIKLRQGNYLESLDLLLHSSPEYWMDAAYVAERVLSLEELKGCIDARFPAAPPRSPDAEREPGADTGQTGSDNPLRSYTGAEAIRYLLGRRLARAYRFADAASYYPPEWRPDFARLGDAWARAEDTNRSLADRGLGLVQAAVLTRKRGLELLGTEVEPDWRIHQGNFEAGVSMHSRASLVSSNNLAASREELHRAASHGVRPERRWHYREVASVMGWEAALLLRAAEFPSPAERARTLFEAGRVLVENDISCVWFMPGRSPLRERGKSSETTTIASRVDRSLAALPANEIWEQGRAPSAPGIKGEGLWEAGLTSAALAWEAAEGLPNNSDETAQILCRGGLWVNWDPHAADILYKALVRRCRKTAVGAEADRLRWFPRLAAQGRLQPRQKGPAPSE